MVNQKGKTLNNVARLKFYIESGDVPLPLVSKMKSPLMLVSTIKSPQPMVSTIKTPLLMMYLWETLSDKIVEKILLTAIKSLGMPSLTTYVTYPMQFWEHVRTIAIKDRLFLSRLHNP